MRLHGYCQSCRKIKQVDVRPETLGAGTPIGTCAECEQKVVDRRRQAPADLTIYVPADSARVSIEPGSGIVGTATISVLDRVHVYYEGGLYSRMSYDEKLLHAADRLVQNYPTVAHAWLTKPELVAVGTYDYGTKTAAITDQATLDAWRARA